MDYKKRHDQIITEAIHKYGHPRKYKKNIIEGLHQHHIIPRSEGGSDDGENIAYLIPSEHFEVHLMRYAFNQDHRKLSAYLSRTVFFMAGVFEVDEVYLNIPHYAELYERACNDARASYVGMVPAYDHETNSAVYIKSTEFQLNKDRYSNFNKGLVSVRCNATGSVFKISQVEYNTHSEKYSALAVGKVAVKEIATGEIIQVDSQEYETNSDLYEGVTKGLVTVKDLNTGNTVQISMDEYRGNPEQYQSFSSGYVVVTDKETGETTRIDKSLFKNDCEQYESINKGFVVVKDFHDGRRKQIKVNEYAENRDKYESIHKGLVVVTERSSGKRMQVTSEIFASHPELYHSVIKEKVSVIEISTGLSKHISMDEFNGNRELYTGVTKGITVALDLITRKSASVTNEDFKNNSRYVGRVFKGWFKTPYGTFWSLPLRGKVFGIETHVTIRDKIQRNIKGYSLLALDDFRGHTVRSICPQSGDLCVELKDSDIIKNSGPAKWWQCLSKQTPKSMLVWIEIKNIYSIWEKLGYCSAPELARNLPAGLTLTKKRSINIIKLFKYDAHYKSMLKEHDKTNFKALMRVVQSF
jgi:hypothetical protein